MGRGPEQGWELILAWPTLENRMKTSWGVHQTKVASPERASQWDNLPTRGRSRCEPPLLPTCPVGCT